MKKSTNTTGEPLVCAQCTLLYAAISDDQACEPGGVCPSCWRLGWRPDGAGGIYQLEQIAVQTLDGSFEIAPPALVDTIASEATGSYPDRASAERAIQERRP